MTSAKKVKPYNPFNGAKFDDRRISILNSRYCSGKISAGEYRRKLRKK